MWSCCVVLLKSVMVPRPFEGCRNAKLSLPAAAGERMCAVVSDQDVVAAAATQRLGAIGSDDDVIAAGAGERGRRGGVVHDGRRGGIAGGVAIGRGVGERTAQRRVVGEEAQPAVPPVLETTLLANRWSVVSGSVSFAASAHG